MSNEDFKITLTINSTKNEFLMDIKFEPMGSEPIKFYFGNQAKKLEGHALMFLNSERIPEEPKGYKHIIPKNTDKKEYILTSDTPFTYSVKGTISDVGEWYLIDLEVAQYYLRKDESYSACLLFRNQRNGEIPLEFVE